MSTSELFDRLKPAVAMVLVQIVFAGVTIFYQLVIDDGMNMKIMVAYRFLFATALLAPLALLLERRERPKLTWMVLFQSFLCGLFGGSLAQNLYITGLDLTSATFVSATSNLIPAFTFVLAVTFGLENFAIRTLGGKAKVLGTLVGISGAMLLTLYKGIEIQPWSAHLIHLPSTRGTHMEKSHQEFSKRVLGALLALGSCLSYSTWLIIQSKLSASYPCHYSSTALMSMMGAVQAVVFALLTERDWTQWKLGWNIRLLSIAFSGMLASALTVTLVAWCVRVRGPLYITVFNPLMLVVVALAGSIFLGEKLHLGSVLGAVLIVTGLYLVLWGKSKDVTLTSQLKQSRSSRVSSDSEAIEVITTSEQSYGNGNLWSPHCPENDWNAFLSASTTP